MSKAQPTQDGVCPNCGQIIPARDLVGRRRVECRHCRKMQEIAVVIGHV